MKKKILFVDDETLILQGLQRMLRPMRHEWDMEFVEGGVQALECMARSPFDVIVSDMRMPGMNGAQLLGEVMKRHPQTIRLILSGHADKDLILKCVGSTHQFLAKPCDPEALKATVHRASVVESAVESEKIKKLVSRMDRIPSIPSLYTEIVESLQDPEVTLEAVGGIIAKDIAMTAKILKLVNSAFFGLRRQVSRPAEAANYLGLDTIRSLVLSINAFSQFESMQFRRFSIESLWSHSLDTAAAAKLIAQLEHADQKVADEAFVAGMLHDVGKLVLAANFPEQFMQVIDLLKEGETDSCGAEQQVFGVNHAGVGGYLLGLWGLPVPIVEAIALHHKPGQSRERSFSPLAAVHAADGLVHQDQATGIHSPYGVMDDLYMAELGLTGRYKSWQAAWGGNNAIAKAA